MNFPGPGFPREPGLGNALDSLRWLLLGTVAPDPPERGRRIADAVGIVNLAEGEFAWGRRHPRLYRRWVGPLAATHRFDPAIDMRPDRREESAARCAAGWQAFLYRLQGCGLLFPDPEHSTGVPGASSPGASEPPPG